MSGFPTAVSGTLSTSSTVQYAVHTPFALHGRLEPDLLDEVTYWIEQYWQYALFAAVAIVRECAER